MQGCFCGCLFAKYLVSFVSLSLKNFSLVNQNLELSLIIISSFISWDFFHSGKLLTFFFILVMFVQLLFKSEITNPHSADFDPLHSLSSKSATSNSVTLGDGIGLESKYQNSRKHPRAKQRSR